MDRAPFVSFTLPLVDSICATKLHMSKIKIVNKNKYYLKFIRGFNLVELMVVIAIVAILASLAAPSFVELLRINRLSAAATAFQVSLSLARSEAIKRGGDSRVSVVAASSAGDWSGGWTVFWHQSSAPTDPAPSSNTSGSVERIEVTAAPSSPVSASYTGSLTSFTYAGNGRLIDPSGSSTVNRSLWFSDGTSQRFCVIVNTSGRPRFERVASGTACTE